MNTTIGPKPIVAPEEQRPALLRIHQLAEGNLDALFKLVGPKGEEVLLPTTLVRLLNEVADCLGRGQAMVLSPLERYVTTQDAADFLNVSRPYVVQLLNRGEIPHMRLNSHRRVRLADLIEYKRQRNADRKEALDELTRLSENYGLYDMPSNDE